MVAFSRSKIADSPVAMATMIAKCQSFGSCIRKCTLTYQCTGCRALPVCSEKDCCKCSLFSTSLLIWYRLLKNSLELSTSR